MDTRLSEELNKLLGYIKNQIICLVWMVKIQWVVVSHGLKSKKFMVMSYKMRGIEMVSEKTHWNKKDFGIIAKNYLKNGTKSISNRKAHT